jgi:hypothetical protein
VPGESLYFGEVKFLLYKKKKRQFFVFLRFEAVLYQMYVLILKKLKTVKNLLLVIRAMAKVAINIFLCLKLLKFVVKKNV